MTPTKAPTARRFDVVIFNADRKIERVLGGYLTQESAEQSKQRLEAQIRRAGWAHRVFVVLST